MSDQTIIDDWKPDVCIYHGNCDDGFGAAWAIWKWWPDCKFVPAHYGMDMPEVTGLNVLFVDFSAKRPVIDSLAQTAKSIVIIDHHKTAEDDLAPFKVTLDEGTILDRYMLPSMFRDLAELNRPPIVAWFDMEQSGAVMAWQFANATHRDNLAIPALLEAIEDRDLWRFKFEDDTRQLSAALRTYPMDFGVWDEFRVNHYRLIDEGRAILRAHKANVEKIVQESYFTEIDGHSVPVVNAPYHYASDVGHALLERFPSAPFAASWLCKPNGQIQWSLRSEEHRTDVSEIAKKFGGGGHRNAAGFLSIEPIETLTREVERLEAVISGLNKQLTEQFDLSTKYVTKATTAEAQAAQLLEAASDVIASASDTYKKRNGHLANFEDDSGEKCWIVPFDAFENLRTAVTKSGEKP